MFSFSNQYLPQRNLYFFIAIVVVTIILILFRRMNKQKGDDFSDKKLPPEMWFYSKLLDIELGIIETEKLTTIFNEYIKYKYRETFDSLNEVVLEQVLRDMETDNKVREFQFELYLDINSLKQSSNDEVIAYVKSIKFNFNKDSLSEWLQEFRADQDCNTC